MATSSPKYVMPSFVDLVIKTPPANKVSTSKEPRTFISKPGFQWPPYPGDKCSLWQRMFYSWFQQTLVTGYYKPIEPTDLTDLPERMKADNYVTELENAFEDFHGWSYQFFFALLYVNRWRYLYKASALRMANLLLTLVRPLLLREILVTVGELATTNHVDFKLLAVGMGWCIVMAVTTVFLALSVHYYYWTGVQCALTVRGAVMGCCFRKALRIDYVARNMHPVSINNLASIDSDALMSFLWSSICEVWACPLQIVLSTLGLLLVLGASAWYGIVVLLALLLVTTKLADKMRKLQQRIMDTADQRVRKFGEALSSIKVIKLYGYEKVFIDSIMAIRRVQERALRYSSVIEALNRCIGFFAPLFTSLVTFSMYAIHGHELDATTAFVALLLFQMLREPLSKLPDSIKQLTRSYVAQERIEAFLRLPDRDDYVQKTPDVHAQEESSDLQESSNMDVEDRDDYVQKTPDLHAQEESSDLQESSNMDVEVVNGTFAWFPAVTDVDEQSIDKYNKSQSVTPVISKSGFTIISDTDNDNLQSAPSSSLQLSSVGDEFASIALPKPALKSINFHLPSGKLLMVIGTVGAGRSSLLMSLLGEMYRISGTVRRPLRTSYAAQTAFLVSGTVRDNIVFGLPFNKQRYLQILNACALERDCLQWPYGDLSLIGENGLMASGGQKARIALARAVYADADLYLFDSPLSAVDSHVAKWLFDHVLGPNGMLRDKTRVLVENHIQYCATSNAHEIIVLRDGEIVDRGTYDDLSQRFDFEAVVAQQKGMMSDNANTTTAQDLEDSDGPSRDTLDAILHNESSMGPRGVVDIEDVKSDTLATEAEAELVETSAQGDTGAALARTYFSLAASPFGWFVILAFLGFAQAAAVLSDYWLSKWSSASTAEQPSHGTQSSNNNDNLDREMHNVSRAFTGALLLLHDYIPGSSSSVSWHSAAAVAGSSTVTSSVDTTSATSSALFYIEIYAILVLSAGLLMLIRSIAVAFASQRASNTLHERFLHAVLAAPQYFFDTNPSGLVSNRFGKDQEAADSQLPNVVGDLLACGAVCIGIIVLVVSVAPLSIIPILFLSVVYFAVQRLYRPGSRELKRLESISRTVIYSAINESAVGLLTLRAFAHNGAVQRTEAVAFERIDANTRIYFAAFGANRWAGVRLEMIGTAFVFVAAFSALLLSSKIGVGLVGLSITVSLSLSANLNWLVRQLSELEVQLNSVERVTEFTLLQSEEEQLSEFLSKRESSNLLTGSGQQNTADVKDVEEEQGKSLLSKRNDKVIDNFDNSGEQQSPIVIVEPPADWPTHGTLTFKNLSVSYKPAQDAPCVIKNLSVTFEGGQKIGLCGRTGSGKSSTILSILRLITWQTGSIMIDGIDISTVPLHTLRSRVSLVPQDPVLFKGSLKYNIDPSTDHADDELWSVLERVKLRRWAESLPGQLDFEVADGGENISLGQRQLCALARAIVRSSRILIMDEATASLDFETDQAIREVLENEFKNCTVICIAHRLGSIMDSDRILVLDAGEMKEFGSPAQLMENPDGYFYKLVEDSNASGL